MKNLSGLLYVIFFCVAAILVAILCVVFIFTFYVALALVTFWIMAKSYFLLGNTWFFIVWPTLIVGLVGYKTYKWFQKRKR